MLGVLMSLMLLILVCVVLNWLLVQFWLIIYMIFMIFVLYTFSEYMCVGGIMGGDAMSIMMIILTFWLCILMFMASEIINDSRYNSKSFMVLVLLLNLTLFMVFGFLDFFWFYIFFELVLIPTLIMILGWGIQPERLQAGMYMLFYTLGASLPLLIMLIYLYLSIGSLSYYVCWYEGLFGFIMSLVMMLAFLVKLPMYLVHLWLPKAHVEAPVAGSMILAGVLLKLGGYGLFRLMNFCYFYLYYYSGVFISICMVGGFVISLVCLCQIDLKSLIAYSSVSHMGMMLGGYFTFSGWGLGGGMVMMIAHGLCSSGLFCLVNIFYERLHTRSIIMIKGMMMIFPSLGLFWFLLSMGNMASPPSINLFGEIMLMISMVGWNVNVLIFIIIISFFSVGYTIYMYSSVNHGKCWIYFGLDSIFVREYLLLFCHLFPMNYLILFGGGLYSWM